jgi:hypothetical protein
MGALQKAVGGLLLLFEFQTLYCFLFGNCTMLVAVLQTNGQCIMELLPVIWDSLWWRCYFILGLGRFGIDYLLTKKTKLNFMKTKKRYF